MSEADLRLKVLKPLFEKMGFSDVFHHHGGAGEQGKDFTMWKRGELGERENFAVVVKAERITGGANPRPASATTVSSQVNQCFGAPFADTTTLEEQRVHKCWVVSSKDISKEAISAIKSMLQPGNLDLAVRFISGDLLWGLIRKEFPTCAALDSLHNATRIFESLDEDWRVAASTSGGQLHLNVEPKDPSADISPLEFKFRLKGSDSAEDQEKLATMRQALETGTKLTLSASDIAHAELPAFIQSIIGTDIAKVELVQRPSCEPLILTLEVHYRDGSRFYFQPLVLYFERAGTKELMLSSVAEDLPWAFDILVNREKNTVESVVWKVSLSKGNVHRLFQALQLWEAMTKPGKVQLRLQDTGVTFLEFPTESAQPAVTPPAVGLFQVLGDLDFIQRTTRTVLFIPERRMTAEELRSIAFVAKVLRTGRVSAPGVIARMPTDREHARSHLILPQDDPERGVTICYQSHVIDVLGQSVRLGPVAVYMPRAGLTEASRQELRVHLEDPARSTFAIELRCPEARPAELFYLDWLSEDADIPSEVRRFLAEPPSAIE